LELRRAAFWRRLESLVMCFIAFHFSSVSFMDVFFFLFHQQSRDAFGKLSCGMPVPLRYAQIYFDWFAIIGQRPA
jgi:hypothetical protein